MLEGYEIFATERSGRTGGTASATVTRAGEINLSRPAYESLGSPDFVLLMYNQHAGTIALKPAGASTPFARRTFRRQNGGGTIHARVFTRFCGLDDGKVHRYDECAVEDGALVIPLRDVAQRRRSAAEREPVQTSEARAIPVSSRRFRLDLL
ncbi:MAG: hypothetical protein NVSMB52_21080 [Chloroflexota bacterium]